MNICFHFRLLSVILFCFVLFLFFTFPFNLATGVSFRLAPPFPIPQTFFDTMSCHRILLDLSCSSPGISHILKSFHSLIEVLETQICVPGVVDAAGLLLLLGPVMNGAKNVYINNNPCINIYL